MENKNLNYGTVNAQKSHIGDVYNITNFIDGLSFLLAEYKQQLDEINGQILSFKPRTALERLNSLESRIQNSQAEIDNKTKSKILFLKALCKKELPEFTKEDTAKDFITAYNLNNDDATIKNRVCVEYLNLSDIPKAIGICENLLATDEYNITAWYIKAVTSNNLKEFLSSIPEIVKEDYNFQLSIIYHVLRTVKLNYFEDIEDFGFKLVFDFTKYKEVNYNNKEAWIVTIDLLINKIFNDYPIRYISGESFIIKDVPEIDIVIKFISKYVNALEKTEISETTKHQKYYVNYLNYITKNNDENYKYLVEIYDELEKPNWFYTNTCCQVLNHKKEFQKSLSVLLEYEKLNGDLNSEFYLFKSVILHFLGKNDEIEPLYSRYLDSIELLDERHVFNIINAFFNIQKQIGIKSSYKILLEKVLEKSFSFEDLKLLFKVIIEVRFIEDFDKEVIYSVLVSIKSNPLFDNNCKNLIADNLDFIGKASEALKFMETYVDKTIVSESLRLYIIIIHKQLHNKKENERGRYKELLILLKFWRLNSNYVDEQLLGFEHNLYTEINDLDKLEEIDEFLYNKFPENEKYLFFYLALLERKKDYDKIKEVSLNVKSTFSDEISGVNIAGILLRNKNNTKKGFEILYNLALNTDNTNARKNYFGGSMLFEEYLEKYNEIKYGHWVRYNIDGRIERIKILKKEGIQKDFIGKKVGDKFSHKSSLSGKLSTIEILEIFNDAINLFREISEEAQNPINELGFESFNIPPDIKDLENFLIEQFGASGTEEKIRTDKLFNDYYNYKIGFSEIVTSVFRENSIDAYLHLTSLIGKRFTTLPNKVTKNINISIIDQKFALDFSTLMLFYFLQKELNFEFNHRFVVPYNIKAEVEINISEEINSPHSPFSINISLDGVRKYETPENYQNKRIEFLQSLLEWINTNCEVDLVDEKLETILKLPKEGKKFESSFMKLIIDSMYLSIRQNHRLISSDSSIFLFNHGSGLYNNLLNPEKYLLTFYPEKCNTEFYRFLLKSNYLGININFETLKNEFFDFITGRDNCYILLLENLQFTINNNPNIIISCIQFLKHLYLINSITIDDKNRYASEIFRNTFYGMSNDLINQYQSILMSEFKLLGDYYDEVIKEFLAVKKMYLNE
jgi:hypothetical protein